MIDSPQQNENRALGVATFERLRAEEEPWIHECFVPPTDFDLMAGDRSIIVFGGAGSGKSAVYHELVHRARRDDRPTRLIVDWHPMPLDAGVAADLAAVKNQISKIFDACVWALLAHLAQFPNDWSSAPVSVRTTITWFVRQFTEGNLDARLGRIIEEIKPEGKVLLQSITANSVADVLDPARTPPEQIAAELVRALKPLGLDGIWVMTDGLEVWAESAPDRLIAGLKNFLSTLVLFERIKFAYKMFVPTPLESALGTASGLLRRRIDSYHLQWNATTLQSLTERRLAFAFGRDEMTLAQLCDAPGLRTWLEITGGNMPREWLDQVRPLAQYAWVNHLTQPINEATWKKMRQENPPRFYLDEPNRQIVVGGRQVSLEQVPSKAYEMLCYLVHHGNQVVSKKELYFRGYQGLDQVPNSKNDKRFQEPVEYEGLVDTNLYRLRRAIEPEPSEPVLLVTIKGHGVKLNVRW